MLGLESDRASPIGASSASAAAGANAAGVFRGRGRRYEDIPPSGSLTASLPPATARTSSGPPVSTGTFPGSTTSGETHSEKETCPCAEDELLHSSEEEDYTLTETSYLGFNIPEAGINAEIYHWFHPVLGTASGGLLIWQGNKHQVAEADFIDYRNFMPYPTSDIADYIYPTGLRVQVIEPLSSLRITFGSADGTTTLDLVTEAIMPAGRTDGKHFAQAMRNRGLLVLNGTHYEIDSYFTRDRSYGSPRPESAHFVSPLTWGAAVFDDDLAPHFVGHDTAANELDNLKWRCVWDGRDIIVLTRMRKTTVRRPDGVTPHAAEVELEDSAGRVFTLCGNGIASMPLSFWPNMVTTLVLMRYELSDGRVGFGDYQDIVFTDFLRSARRPAP